MKYNLLLIILTLLCIYFIGVTNSLARGPIEIIKPCNTEGYGFENGEYFYKKTIDNHGYRSNGDVIDVETDHIIDCSIYPNLGKYAFQLGDYFISSSGIYYKGHSIILYEKIIFDSRIWILFSIFLYGYLYVLYGIHSVLSLNYHNNRLYQYFGLLSFFILVIISFTIFNTLGYFTIVKTIYPGYFTGYSKITIFYFLFFQFYFFRKILIKNISGFSSFKEIVPSIFAVLVLILLASMLREFIGYNPYGESFRFPTDSHLLAPWLL